MEQKNLVDAFMTRLKSNRLIAVVIIVAGFIIAVDRFTNATDSLTKKIKIATPVKPLGITLRDTPQDLSSDAAGVMIAEKGFFDIFVVSITEYSTRTAYNYTACKYGLANGIAETCFFAANK